MSGETSRKPAMTVTWLDEGRQAQHPADPKHLTNPAYPKGVDVDCSGGAKATCTQALPYPAKGCGQHLVTCDICGRRIIVTAAGRADDPRSVKVACKIAGHA